MTRSLLKLSAIFTPLGILVPMVSGVLTPGYSSIRQQMSELEMLGGLANVATRTGSIVSGVAILAFALALVLQKPTRMPFTAFLASFFGINMISNGIFMMGGPLHGLYGIGLTIILVPASFAAERRHDPHDRQTDQLSLLAAVLILVYMWAQLTGQDPAPFRGLTQRLDSVVMFGWFSYASAKLLSCTEHAPAIQAGVVMSQ